MRRNARFAAAAVAVLAVASTPLLAYIPAWAAACTQTVGSGTQTVSGTSYTSRVVTFTGAGCSSTFAIPDRATIEVLVVGGGGGGGGGVATSRSGGGGGGGVVNTSTATVTNTITVTVSVGAGGSAGSGSGNGGSGGSSSLTGTGISVTSAGGGGGTSASRGVGGASGSNAGGSPAGSAAFAGGGGGAGGAGNANGIGGVGRTWAVASRQVGGGGSGGAFSGSPRQGASFGGGLGVAAEYCLGAAGANTGGGGGGGAANANGCAAGGGAGAAGVVAISYVTTVTFDANGGSGSMASQTRGAASNLTANAFTRSGYTFAGWATTPSGAVAYANSASYDFTTGGTTLYATWTPVTQTITYAANGGNGFAANTTGATDSSVTLSTGGTMTRAGYALTSWNTAAGGGGTSYTLGQAITMPAGGLALYAIWSAQTQTISYNLNGGTGALPNSNALTDSSVTLPDASAVTKPGYGLSSWNTAIDGSGTSYAPGQTITMPAGGSTLYAQWSAQTQTITYNANGGTGSVAGTTGATDSTVSLQTGAGLNGGANTFLGWNTNPNALTPSYTAGQSITMPAGGLALYAIWDPPLIASIAYDANGGLGTTAATSGTVGSTVTLSGGAGLTRAGYALTSWNTAADGSGTSYGLAPATIVVPDGGLTLYAIWTAQTQTITYAANGGAGSEANTTGATDASVALSGGDSLSRPGYALESWNTAADGSGGSYGLNQTISMPAGGLALYAIWAAQTQAITYDANGGTGSVADTEGATDSTVGLATGSGLTRAGYAVASWNTAADGSGTSYSLGQSITMPAGGLALYAIWAAQEQTITYRANGGTGSTSPTKGNTDASIALSSGVGLDGGVNTLLGWDPDPAAATPTYTLGQSITMPAGGLILYAIWDPPLPVSITYAANGGSGSIADQTAIIGTTMVLSAGSGFTRAGYALQSWNTAANGSGTSYSLGQSITMPGDGIALFAIWAAQSQTISFDANGGSGTLPNLDALTDSSVTLPGASDISRPGYSLAGWDSSPSANPPAFSPGETITMPAGGGNYYAIWSAQTQTIAYDANGGTGTEADSTASTGSSVTLSSGGSLARTGYTLSSWNSAADGSGGTYPLGQTIVMPAGGLVLYATWAGTAQTITYTVNGGTGSAADTTANTDASATLSSGGSMVRAGYTLSSWNTAADGSGTSYSLGQAITMPVGGLSLYAIWTGASQTITYGANGGSGTAASTTGITDTSVTLSSGGALSKPGYALLGWDASASAVAPTYALSQLITMPAGGLTLYAIWSAQTQTITYSANGGSGTEPDTTGATSSTATLSSGSALSRAGYTLDSWNTAANGSGSTYPLGQSIVMPAGGLTLYAIWTAAGQTASYSANGGSGSAPGTTGATGSTVTLSTGGTLARPGYTLAGWNTAADGSGTAYSLGQSITMPAGGLSLYAVWSAQSQTISYGANGSTGNESATSADTGTSVTLSTGTNLSGGASTFLGWDTNPNALTPTYTGGQSITMPAGGLTLYAIWDPPLIASVVYQANGGSGAIANTAGTVGSSVTLSTGAGLTRVGYTLASWNTAANGSGTSYSLGQSITMPSGGRTVYAIWTAVAQSITYDANGGSGSEASTVGAFGTTVTLSSGSNLTGGASTFLGWDADPSALSPTYTAGQSITMPLGGLSLYAIWDPPLPTPSPTGTASPTPAPTPQLWTLTYSSNGGSCTASSGQNFDGSWLVLPAAADCSRPGYVLVGWNTAADGSGLGFAPGGSTLMSGDNTLYAQWAPLAPPRPTPSQSANQGSGGRGPIPAPPPLAPGESGVVVGPQRAPMTGPSAVLDPLKGAVPSQGATIDPNSVAIWDGASWVKTYDDPGVGTWRIVDGKVVFTPVQGFCGTAGTTVKVTDSKGKAGLAPVALDIPCPEPGSGGSGTVPPPPSAGIPAANAVSTIDLSGAAGASGGSIIASKALVAVGAEMSSMVLWDGRAWVRSFTDPGVGTWQVVGDRIAFIPAPGFSGVARTTFRVSARDGLAAQGPVAFTVASGCSQRSRQSLVIGFAPSETVISRPDRKRLVSMLQPECSYVVLGYVQPVGSTASDRALSLDRAQAAAAILRNARPALRITVLPEGRRIERLCIGFENRCAVIRPLPPAR